MNNYTFIVFRSDGKRRQYTCKASSEDNAWDKVYQEFPNAEYIELFGSNETD